MKGFKSNLYIKTSLVCSVLVKSIEIQSFSLCNKRLSFSPEKRFIDLFNRSIIVNVKYLINRQHK